MTRDLGRSRLERDDEREEGSGDTGTIQSSELVYDEENDETRESKSESVPAKSEDRSKLGVFEKI